MSHPHRSRDPDHVNQLPETGTAVIFDLVLIGLAIALAPLPLAAFILVLPSQRGLRKGAAFVFGWFVALVIVVTVTVLAAGNKPPKPNTSPSLAVLAVKIAVGVALVAVAIRYIWRRGRPKKPPKWQQKVDRMSPWFALGLAATMQPWALVGAGAAVVVEAKLASWESYLTLVLFCVLASASYFALEIYAVFKPGPSKARLARLRAWIDTHTDQVIIVGCLVVGIWLIAKSSYQLVT